MKKVILVVEDNPKEMEAAKMALSANGFKSASATNLSDANRIWNKLGRMIRAVLTDLHFPERDEEHSTELTGKNPNGLALITRALAAGIPISVCSDINHHFAAYLKETIANLEQISGRKIPFTMDQKNWEDAVKNLKNQLTEEEQ